MTDRKRLLELALQGLESEQARIAEEIAAVRSELGITGVANVEGSGSRARSKRQLSDAHRDAIGARMKKVWAARKKAKK